MVEYSVYYLEAGELTGRGPRSEKSQPSIFVAYRFKSAESMNFRTQFEAKLSHIEALRDVDVVDGRVLPGDTWSTTIRKRIKRARLVVADVSYLSREVLFECGFAWGLSRRILPVLESSSLHSDLPRWLTALQVGHYSDKGGWNDILDSVSENLGIERRWGVPPPDPIPHRIAWLGEGGKSGLGRRQLEEVCRRFGLTIAAGELVADDIDDAEESLILEVCRSSLVIAFLDGTSSDCLYHFCAGVVVAHPTAGAASRKLVRRVLFVVTGGLSVDEVLADSARRVTRNIRVIHESDLAKELLAFGGRYESWRQEQEEL